MNLGKIWQRYDKNKEKVCSQKNFEIVKTLQQNASNREGGGDSGGCGGGYDGGGGDAGGGSGGVGVG